MRMKTMIASVVSLLLGLAIGWYAERRHAEHEKTEIVQQMLQAGESSDREGAVRAVSTIGSIQSGDIPQAMQLLSAPVARYCELCTAAGSKDERRAETRAIIQQLARTHQVVAARIAELSRLDSTVVGH
jgi:hypothetical protein